MRLPLLALCFLVLAAPIAFADDNQADYRAVIIPLVSHGLPGAHGSVWDAELHVFNASQLSLRMRGAIEDSPVLPIDPAVFVAPLEARRVDLNPREASVDGALLYVPNTHVDTAKFSLRVRDTSQNATSLGDDVPVVREGKNDVTIIDVPVDPKYRATLRIYGFTPARMQVLATVFPERGNVPLAEFDLDLRGILTTDSVPFPPHPAYIAIDPLTDAVRAAANGTRVRIEVTNFASLYSRTPRIFLTPPPPHIWAFVSLTNNETNQVTIVAPK